MVDARSYEEYIRRYIENATALIKKEKVKNTVTGKYEEVNMYSIEEFEKSINLQENAESFRSGILSKLGAYSLDNPGKALVYTDVFPDLTNRLQQSFRVEQEKVIKNIANNIVFFESEANATEDGSVKTPMSKANREQIEEVVANLCKNHHYSEKGAIALVRSLIKERY